MRSSALLPKAVLTASNSSPASLPNRPDVRFRADREKSFPEIA
jgi:hypothetical protein